MKKRTVILLKQYLLLGGIGLIYAVWIQRTGIGIPCIIRTITGMRCPGCGITHMCLYLLQGKVGQAFLCNRGVFLFLPVLAVLWIRYMYRYIRKGTTKGTTLDRTLLVGTIAGMLLWGIIRNLPVFQYLNY